MSNYVLPDFVPGDIRANWQKGSPNPIERDIWNTIRRLEREVEIANAKRGGKDDRFTFWAYDHLGAHCCWSLEGRTIKPKPSLDYYEGDVGHP